MMRRAAVLGLALAPLLLGASHPDRAAAPSAPSEPAERVLVIVPLGKPDPKLVNFIAASVERRFKLDVHIADPVPLPKEAWYAPRKRWRADTILDHLDAMELEGAWRVAGITERPISTTKDEYFDWGIAGLGTLDGRSSVLSSYYFRRFKKKAPKKYQRYMENLVLHEVGHTLGLDHCPLDRCIMADAHGKAVTAAEKSINEFCPRCNRLAKPYLRDPEVKGHWSAAERAVLDDVE